MELETFTRITGISVHLINNENQDIKPPVQHFLLRSIPIVTSKDEDWTVSVVLVYDYGNYEVLVEATDSPIEI